MKHINICPICGGTEFTNLEEVKDYTASNETFNIILCQSCGLAITSPRPEDKDLGKYYQSEEYISHSGKSSGIIEKLYLIARTFTLKWKTALLKQHAKGNRLLDYGCGTGEFLSYTSTKGFDVAGIEPSDRARLKANQLTGSKVYSDLNSLPGTFDVITLWHVLEHVSDPSEVISSLRSKLNKQGVLIVAVPNINAWESTHYKAYWAAYDTPRHLWHFNRKSLSLLVKRSSMKVIEIKPMKLDSYYVSMLSEKYQNGKRNTVTGMINAFIIGLKSNLKAKSTGEYSSLIYIITNEN
jgi:2-polyprenyl-3-methyl-5-hydroxy-6-metoxy-1,4-benzoquinol methylase